MAGYCDGKENSYSTNVFIKTINIINLEKRGNKQYVNHEFHTAFAITVLNLNVVI